jgi:dipeptidyl aminopeptidase/acylaminoacyl peptidase
VVELAPELDVSWLEWRDSTSLWYAGPRGLGTVCGWLSLDGSVRELWSGDATLGARYLPRLSAAAGGVRLVAVKEAWNEPREVVSLDPDRPDVGWRPVTQLNAHLAGADPPGCERLVWASGDGLQIEGLLVRPPARGREPHPLVVLVHGGPTACWSFQFGPLHALLLAHAGYAVLLPNPRGSAGRGQDFARANLGDLGGAELDDTLTGIDACVDAGLADSSRVAIMGGSHGGYIAAWAVTQTDRFAAAIPIASVSDLVSSHFTTNIANLDELLFGAVPDPLTAYLDRSPIAYAENCRTPTLIIHGELDNCCPVSQAHELYHALAGAGAEVELVIYPREGHAITEWSHQVDVWTRIERWLDRYLTRAGAGE